MSKNVRLTLIALLVAVCAGILYLVMRQRTDKPAQVQEPSEEVPVVQAEGTEPATVSVFVQEGDTLWKLAQKHCGSPYFYPGLAARNDIVDPDKIYPGQEIIIACDAEESPQLRADVQKPRAPEAIAPATRTPDEPKQESAAAVPAPALEPPASISEAPKPETQPETTQPESPKPEIAQIQPPQTKIEEVPESRPEPPESKKPEPAPPAPSPQIAQLPYPLPSFPRTLPGSFWTSFDSSPVERNNAVGTLHIDQAFTLFTMKDVDFQLYGALNASGDTAGNTWNRRLGAESGLKITRSFSHGLINLGGAWMTERRPDARHSGPIAYTGGWFGWDQISTQPSLGRPLSSFPGNMWWITGLLSPSEKGNYSGILRLEQGMTLFKSRALGGLAFVPTGRIGGGFDTDMLDWNNKVVYGGGLKIVFPTSAGSVGLQGGYECEKRWVQTRGACGTVFHFDFWTGWKPPAGGR
ncbi:MAG: LysM peptidoglycan-binding domain-containing protein [bacterium]|nr:LysM peptidoglycan-binding domain-containing protein [bacterium]